MLPRPPLIRPSELYHILMSVRTPGRILVRDSCQPTKNTGRFGLSRALHHLLVRSPVDPYVNVLSSTDRPVRSPAHRSRLRRLRRRLCAGPHMGLSRFACRGRRRATLAQRKGKIGRGPGEGAPSVATSIQRFEQQSAYDGCTKGYISRFLIHYDTPSSASICTDGYVHVSVYPRSRARGLERIGLAKQRDDCSSTHR